MPRAVCGDPANQFAFEAGEAVCWPTWFLEQYQAGPTWKAKAADTKAATRLSAKFKKGQDPELLAGLGLPREPGDQRDDQ